MTLAEFLAARIEEDEAAARGAGGEYWYTAVVPGESMRKSPDEPTHTIIDSPKSLITYEVCTDEMAEHIVRHDPERVLAECEAKRRIVRRHTLCDDTSFGEPCEDLRDLAVPYRDHPDYRQEWKP